MEYFKLTEENYEGYVELFNKREELSNKNKVKNLKIYAGIAILSLGITVGTSLNTDYQIGLSVGILVGGWLSLIQMGRIFFSNVDDLDFSEISEMKKKYPHIDPHMNQELLFLAFSEKEMLTHKKKDIYYAEKEKFQKNPSKILHRKNDNI